MEEIENQINNNIQVETIKIKVKASEITKKFKSAKDRQGFCRELSNLFFYNFRSIFSE